MIRIRPLYKKIGFGVLLVVMLIAVAVTFTNNYTVKPESQQPSVIEPSDTAPSKPEVIVEEPIVLQPEEPQTETHTIEIINYNFVPEELTINVGDTVTWVNKDTLTVGENTDYRVHVVAGHYGKFRSPRLLVGDTYSYTFAEAGTYTYTDAVSPSNTGIAKIIVKEPGLEGITGNLIGFGLNTEINEAVIGRILLAVMALGLIIGSYLAFHDRKAMFVL